MMQDIRKPLQTALSRLQTDRARIDKQISAIETVLNLDDQSSNGRRPRARKANTRGMSAAARRAVSKRMKAYWAKQRKGQGKRKAS